MKKFERVTCHAHLSVLFASLVVDEAKVPKLVASENLAWGFRGQ